MNELGYIKDVKGYISLQDQREQPRLRAFLSEYERGRSEFFSNLVKNNYEMFFKNDITIVGSGFPYFIFNCIEEIYYNPIAFADVCSVDENNLREIVFDRVHLPLNRTKGGKAINIKLIDYSPLIKKHFNSLNKIYKDINFSLYTNNINFEDIRDITKNSIIFIPYSEYLYILNELDIFNPGQTVLVFNQLDDEEKRKNNAVSCIEDLLDQCPFREVFYADKVSISAKSSSNLNKENVNLYAILGKT